MSRRHNDPAQMTLFSFSRVERTGFDAQGNATLRVVQDLPVGELRPAAAAHVLGVSTRTIYDMIDAGVIRHDEYRRPGAGRIIWISAAAITRLRDRKPA
jgi:excisionase family DNA binding protein